MRFNALSNAILNRIVETTDEIGVFTATTGNSFDFSSSTGANLPNAFLGSWAGNGAKCEISGTITPASDAYRLGFTGGSGALGIKSTLIDIGGTPRGLIVGGGNAVVLAADNTFTGDTVIRDGGRLFIGTNLAMQNSALDTSTGILSLHDTIGAGGIVGVEKTDHPTLGGIFGNRNFASIISTANQNNTTRLPVNQVLGLTLNPGAGKTYDYTGAITEMSVGTYLAKTGEGTQILQGTNTYTGDTTISAGTLQLSETGHLAFVIGADDTNNKITGTGGTVDLAGIFDFDLTGASQVPNDSWTIVDTSGGLAATYEATFAITDFTKSGTTWTKDIDGTNFYQFDPSTGLLKVATPGPEGDANGDGVVDAADYILVKQNFGKPGTSATPLTAT